MSECNVLLPTLNSHSANSFRSSFSCIFSTWWSVWQLVTKESASRLVQQWQLMWPAAILGELSKSFLHLQWPYDHMHVHYSSRQIHCSSSSGSFLDNTSSQLVTALDSYPVSYVTHVWAEVVSRQKCPTSKHVPSNQSNAVSSKAVSMVSTSWNVVPPLLLPTESDAGTAPESSNGNRSMFCLLNYIQ